MSTTNIGSQATLEQRQRLKEHEMQRDVEKAHVGISDSAISQTRPSPSSRGRAPPDGGWGWVIVFAGGFALSIAMGFNKSVALVYQALLEKFQQSAAATAWVTSLTGMIRMMSSPFVSALCNRFTHRKVAIAAGFITSTSYILSAFPPNLPYLYITLGLMQGIGVNMFIVPSLSITAIYFDRNKGKAMSMITSSFGFGALYMAPLLRVLFNEYGYTGALLILGALVLHFTAAGLLFRPLSLAPKWDSEDDVVDDDSGGCGEKHRQGQHVAVSCSRPDLLKTSTGRPLDGDMAHEREKRQPLLQQHQQLNEKPDAKKSLEYADGGKSTSELANPCVKVWCAVRRGASSLVRELGLHMLGDTQFLLLCFTMTGIAWSMTNSWTMAAGLAREKNFTTTQVTVLLVVIAAAELPCRLVSGVLFDIAPLRKLRPIMFALVAFIVGVGNASLPFVPGVIPTFIVWSLMMGLLGSCNSQYPTVMSDLVGGERVTSGLGLIRLLQGIGALLGPFMGGLLRDHTGTYAYGFYAGGLIIVIFSVLLAIRSYCLLNSKKAREITSDHDEQRA